MNVLLLPNPYRALARLSPYVGALQDDKLNGAFMRYDQLMCIGLLLAYVTREAYTFVARLFDIIPDTCQSGV